MEYYDFISTGKTGQQDKLYKMVMATSSPFRSAET